MRRIGTQVVAWILILIGWSVGTPLAQAQQQLTLLEYTNLWKFSTNINLDAVNWRATNYNDASWSSGRGLLGVEPTPAAFTRAPFNTVFSPYSPAIQTYYFRTTFSFSGNLSGVSLISSNYIDDGAVIYLNGSEVGRVRVAANATWNTGATATGGEGAHDVVTFPSGFLLEGNNVLAVELHQSGTASSDIVWGMKLVAIIPTPIVITNQPRSQTNDAGTATTFSVGVTGTLPTYQWFSNDVAIAGATNAAYTIGNTRTNHAATYFVRVSNDLGTVQSSNAVLTVVTDEAGPLLVLAQVDEVANDRVIVNFNETLLRTTATNPANYAISFLGATNKLVVFTNIVFNNNQVRLTVSPAFDPANTYVLTVNNVSDTNGNAILPNSQIGIGSWRSLSRMTEDPWRFHVWGYEPGIGSDPGPSVPFWKDPAYEDSEANLWAGNAPDLFYGLFYNETDVLPAAKRTLLSLGHKTYYFRTSVVVSNMVPRGTLRLRHIIDDGAIFYFNGVEILRFNMPADAITYDTPASTIIGNATLGNPIHIDVTNVLSGTNVIAVEVHQQSATSNDIVFGAQVDGLFAPASPGPLRLNIALLNQPGPMVQLSWEATGATLQSSSNPSGGPWADVSTTGNSYTTVATDGARFYRLQP